MNGVEPILVVFEDKNDKDQLWMKLSIKLRDDMVERRESVVVTQVCNILHIRIRLPDKYIIN